MLVARGAHVVLGVRSVQAGWETEQKLNRLGERSRGSAQFLHLDLGNLDSVRAFAGQVKSKVSRLDGLILNAGIMATKPRATIQGFEEQVGVCHVGHFLLTQLLLDLVEKSAPSRIVSLTSVGHNFWTQPSVNTTEFVFNEEEYAKMSLVEDMAMRMAWYGRAKLANILFVRELARRMKESGKKVWVNAVHPGGVQTHLGDHIGKVGFAPYDAFVEFVNNWFQWTVQLDAHDGSLTTLFAACAPEVETEDIQGQYLVPIARVAQTSTQGANMTLAREVWDGTEKLVRNWL